MWTADGSGQDRLGWISDLIAQVWIGDCAFPEPVTKYSHQHLDPLKIIGEEPWDISLTSMCSNIDPSNLVIQKAGAAHYCENNTRLVSEDRSEWSVWGRQGWQRAPCWSTGLRHGLRETCTHRPCTPIHSSDCNNLIQSLDEIYILGCDFIPWTYI